MPKHLLGIALLLSLMTAGALEVEPDSATVVWQHPSQYVDSTPLDINDIEATEIEYGPCHPTQTAVNPLTAKTMAIMAPTEYVVGIPLPTPGLWCFRARTRMYGLDWSAWTDAVVVLSPQPPYAGSNLPPFKLVM
jgi:hypothetical protein